MIMNEAASCRDPAFAFLDSFLYILIHGKIEDSHPSKVDSVEVDSSNRGLTNGEISYNVNPGLINSG